MSSGAIYTVAHGNVYGFMDGGKRQNEDRPKESRDGRDRTGEMEGGDGSRLVLAYRTLWERI